MLSKTSVKAMRKAIDEARRDRRALDVRTWSSRRVSSSTCGMKGL